jgi:TRAP-type C4-dicarboxylate transport system permease small subunit
MQMGKYIAYLSIILVFILISTDSSAQCSICTKTASQLGEGPAKALNNSIVYLMLAPFAVMGYIGYRWWKDEKNVGA